MWDFKRFTSRLWLWICVWQTHWLKLLQLPLNNSVLLLEIFEALETWQLLKRLKSPPNLVCSNFNNVVQSSNWDNFCMLVLFNYYIRSFLLCPWYIMNNAVLLSLFKSTTVQISPLKRTKLNKFHVSQRVIRQDQDKFDLYKTVTIKFFNNTCCFAKSSTLSSILADELVIN